MNTQQTRRDTRTRLNVVMAEPIATDLDDRLPKCRSPELRELTKQMKGLSEPVAVLNIYRGYPVCDLTRAVHH